MGKAYFLICTTLYLALGSACKSDTIPKEKDPYVSSQKTHYSEAGEPADYHQIARGLSSSCMPCHNHATLTQVIERVKKADFQEIEGETRLRILNGLENLKTSMDQGLPISFTSQAQVDQFIKVTPGEFYMMLEKGLMPPPWAPELMRAINWPNYEVLALEDRVEMLKYAKPFSQKYLR